MDQKMNHDRMIEDLMTLKEFFSESGDGPVPLCLEYAIYRLSEMGPGEAEVDDGK